MRAAVTPIVMPMLGPALGARQAMVTAPSVPPVASYRILRTTGDRRIVRGGDARIVRP